MICSWLVIDTMPWKVRRSPLGGTIQQLLYMMRASRNRDYRFMLLSLVVSGLVLCMWKCVWHPVFGPGVPEAIAFCPAYYVDVFTRIVFGWTVNVWGLYSLSEGKGCFTPTVSATVEIELYGTTQTYSYWVILLCGPTHGGLTYLLT